MSHSAIRAGNAAIALVWISSYGIGWARGIVRSIDDLYLSRCLTFIPCRIVACLIVSYTFVEVFRYILKLKKSERKLYHIVSLLAFLPLVICMTYSEDESYSLHWRFGLIFAVTCMLSGISHIVERGLTPSTFLMFLFFVVGSVGISKNKNYIFGFCEKGVAACMLCIATT